MDKTSTSREEKNKIVQEMLCNSPIFTRKFEEKMHISVKKFSKLVPLMPNSLFDQLYAVLLLESKQK